MVALRVATCATHPRTSCSEVQPPPLRVARSCSPPPQKPCRTCCSADSSVSACAWCWAPSPSPRDSRVSRALGPDAMSALALSQPCARGAGPAGFPQGAPQQQGQGQGWNGPPPPGGPHHGGHGIHDLPPHMRGPPPHHAGPPPHMQGGQHQHGGPFLPPQPMHGGQHRHGGPMAPGGVPLAPGGKPLVLPPDTRDARGPPGEWGNTHCRIHLTPVANTTPGGHGRTPCGSRRSVTRHVVRRSR